MLLLRFRSILVLFVLPFALHEESRVLFYLLTDAGMGLQKDFQVWMLIHVVLIIHE